MGQEYITDNMKNETWKYPALKPVFWCIILKFLILQVLDYLFKINGKMNHYNDIVCTKIFTLEKIGNLPV